MNYAKPYRIFHKAFQVILLRSENSKDSKRLIGLRMMNK